MVGKRRVSFIGVDGGGISGREGVDLNVAVEEEEEEDCNCDDCDDSDEDDN